MCNINVFPPFCFSLLPEEDKISPPLTIQHRVGFKSRYVDHSGNIHTSKPSSPTILVQATTHVSDTALLKASFVSILNLQLSLCGKDIN